ncbi:hypothetical protein RHS01_04412 [Rhizoctonia solani]|uniref:Sld7 C-terminal domain-containing protein n=1 Tax=Rhizoctonia solani TaxID=456999 RepID=A0A8H7M602_9AGAM|nr:hypothetical protein RHS01_04412 [Rhizoctonia solani]
MATRPYVLSSPPKAAASAASKMHSRRASASGDVKMSLTPTRVPKPSNSDVEMRGSSDGWETVTQDSAWDEDGIQFIARLPGVVPPLLSAPLPLALESMRRIPALKLRNNEVIPDTARLDTEIDVRLLRYPWYFQRVLALGAEYIPERPLLRSPHPHPHIDPRITSTAVRIGLGEDVIVVYGRLQSEEYARVERGQGTGKLELVAARLLDPTCQSDDSSTKKAKRNMMQCAPSRPWSEDQTHHVGHETVREGAERGCGQGLGEQIDTPLSKPTKLKEPTSSVRRKGGGGGKGKSKAEEADDPFAVGGPESEVDASAVLPKMMARVKSASAAAPVAGSGGEETANKATRCLLQLIKRLAQSALETYGIDREDPGFKEVFGYVTRGVGFAFRNKMKCEKIGKDELRRMVVRHVELYVAGNGDVAVPA